MSENSLLEDVDTAELLQHVDIENVLTEKDVSKLLEQVDLESVLGGFGAAAGSELGVKLGRRLDATFDTAEGESADESTDEAVSSDDEPAETDDGSEASNQDPEVPDSREGLEDLSYRELQTLAADTDVKGNISRDRMVDGLATAFGLDDE